MIKMTLGNNSVPDRYYPGRCDKDQQGENGGVQKPRPATPYFAGGLTVTLGTSTETVPPPLLLWLKTM
jgi:hypothetical protein